MAYTPDPDFADITHAEPGPDYARMNDVDVYACETPDEVNGIPLVKPCAAEFQASQDSAYRNEFGRRSVNFRHVD